MSQPEIGTVMVTGDWYELNKEEEEIRAVKIHTMQNTERHHGILLGPITLRPPLPGELSDLLPPPSIKGDARFVVAEATVIGIPE